MTTIEWTDATWNPATGCTKVSQGCKNCYAERVFPRVYAKTGRQFADVQCHPDRLDAPLHWRKPRMVFVNSMSDLFHEAVPESFVDEVFGVMVDADHHTYQILTKRPKRMLDYMASRYGHGGGQLRPPSHVWLGVSVEDQETADERIPWLLQTPAAVRFVSAEPLLGPIVFDSQTQLERRTKILTGASAPRIDWVIVGGESGPKARPCNVRWIENTIDQCAASGVKCFVKQLGTRPVWAGAKCSPINHASGKNNDPAMWPESLRVREWPK